MDRPHVFPRASGPPGPSPADMRVAANDPSPRERAARIVRTIEADIIPRLVRLHSAHGGETPAPESGAAEEELGVAYAADPLEIGFNAKYLLEIAGQIDRENAVFMLNGPGDPALIREGSDTSAVYVVMPMRV